MIESKSGGEELPQDFLLPFDSNSMGLGPMEEEEMLTEDEARQYFDLLVSDSKGVFAEFGEPDTFVATLFDDGDIRETPEVTEDDFEPYELPIFRSLRYYMRALVNKNTPTGQRIRYLHWMMSPFVADKNGLLFNDACLALRSRPVVVRTRALYQMWVNGITIDEELPLVHEPIPKFVLVELENHPAISRIPFIRDVAKVAWSMPGRPFELVLEAALRKEIPDPMDAFLALEDYGYAARTLSGRSYLVCRNPSIMTLKRRATFSWAKEIIDYD